MTPAQAWQVLELAETRDAAAIRRAYAARLKAMDIDRDVEGYARLRQARDAALNWARRAASAEAAGAATALPDSPEPPAPSDQERPPAGWLYGAPSVEDPQVSGKAEPGLTTRLPSGGPEEAPRLDVTGGVAAAQAPAERAIAVGPDPFARPVLLGLESPPDAVMPAWAHEQALYRLLLTDLPGGSDEKADLPPLEAWQEAMALGHLKAVLHNAETASVSAFDEIENWLANLLWDAWPRSAPLLEPAAAVFGWEQERGQISERPAIAFLNARLRGLRFREKVQDPAHPLHKAWKELTTPAQQGSRRGWFVKRADVEQLLDGVRRHFPEIERHFDPWRVALWDRQGDDSGGQGWFSKGRLAIFAVIFIVQIIRMAMDAGGSNDRRDAPVPPALSASEAAQDREVIGRAIRQVFGPEITLEGLQSLQPDLAALFSANRTVARSAGEDDAAYAAKVHDLVRERMLATALAEKGQLLADVQRLRARLLEAAQKLGPAECMAFIRTRRLDRRAEVAPAILAAERKLAVKMLDASQLGPPARQPPARASIPGDLVDRVIAATGIPDRRVRAAMGGKGPDADQCAVTIALIEQTLAWKGPAAGRDAILSVL